MVVIINEELVKIKETKHIKMYASEHGTWLHIDENKIWIPIGNSFPVKRGLESFIQKFYRRKKRRIVK